MPLYGSFHSYIEGRQRERCRDVYTQWKKLININGQEGSNREQRKARRKKERKPYQTTRHSLSQSSADVLCL